MAINYVTLEGVLLTASSATLYTAPSTVLVSIVRSLFVVNSDSSDRQVQLNKLPPSGSTTTANLLRASSSNNIVAAGKTEAWDVPIPIAPSGILNGKSDSANVVAVHALIVEIS